MLSLIIIAVWSASLFVVSLLVVGVFPFYRGDFFWFTFPFIAASGLCAAIAILGIFQPRRRRAFFRIVTSWHALLFLPVAFAMDLWPPGDHETAVVWLLIIGGGSIVAFALALALIIIVWLTERRTGNA